MNTIFRNSISYHYESFWRKSKKDNSTDSDGNLFPWPKEGNIYWTDKQQFKEKLIDVQNLLKNANKYDSSYFNNPDCLLCGEKNITSGVFNLNNIIWEDGLLHYIDVHNVRPSSEFVDNIYKFQKPSRSFSRKRSIKYESQIYTIENANYVKLERNQIMIMDALMKHGGYSRKYIDHNNKGLYRYSEHAGLLDFHEHGLEKLVISGKTNRIDKGDEEIYLPKNMSEALDYEYIFHTHPPTPKPGGRAKLGILYEFPSISDIFHFIDHFNDGVTQGSLVLTPEGLYNIRKLVFDRKKIIINEDQLYDKAKKAMRIAQDRALAKYGTEFTSLQYFSKISQDREYINIINQTLNNFKIQIDYFSREKDGTGKWIIDTIYLPIFVIEPQHISQK